VILPCVAGPEVGDAVVGVAEPEVFAVVSAAAELSPEVVVLAAEPEVVFVVDLEASEPEVVSVAVVAVVVVSVADGAEPQASVDTRIAFDVSLPVSGVAVEVDSPGRPRSLAFPSVDYHASPSSSAQAVGQESVQNSTSVRANDDLCSILSNLGLRQNKILEHNHNKPNHGHNNASDTNDLPMDATTSHSRKTALHLCLEQHIHRPYQVSLLPPVVREI